MTTLIIILCFTSVLAAYSVQGAASERKNGFVMMKKGENFTMECSTTDDKKDNFVLYARLPSKHIVVVFDKNTDKASFGNGYSERVKIGKNMHKLTVGISDLQLDDSGLYIGEYSNYDLDKNVEDKKEGCSILLFVKDVDDVDKTSLKTIKPADNGFAMSEPLVLVFALTACTMLVVCFLVIWVLTPKVKAQCLNQADDASREYNPVYEDMHRVQNK